MYSLPTKKFNGVTMAKSEPEHDTANDLIDYARSAGLLRAHGGRKKETNMWRKALDEVYGPNGCLRGYARHNVQSRKDVNWTKFRTHFQKLIETLSLAYKAKIAEKKSPLAIEQKGHLAHDEWETSSIQMKREKAGEIQDKAHTREQCDEANQRQGLVHGQIPLLSPRTNQQGHQQGNQHGHSRITPSHDTNVTSNTNQPTIDLTLDNGPPPLPEMAPTNNPTSLLQPRGNGQATRDHYYASRNTASMEDESMPTSSNEVMLSYSTKRAASQLGNPRPCQSQTRQRIGGTGNHIPQTSITSTLHFPTVEGATPIRPHHTVTADERARQTLASYDNGQDIATSIFNSLQDVRRNTQNQRLNFPPSTPSRASYLDQAEAWSKLTNAIGGVTNIDTDENKTNAMTVFNSIMSNIGSAAKNNGSEVEGRITSRNGNINFANCGTGNGQGN